MGRIINLPNFLTLLRLVGSPLVPFLALEDMKLAFYVFVFLAVTDALDGLIARIYGQITFVGKLMDPVADKLLMFSGLITVTFMAKDPVPDIIFYTVLMRDISLILGSIILIPKGFKPEPALWGKLATTFQAIFVTLAFVVNIYGEMPFMKIVLIVTLALTVISWTYYIIKGIEFVLSETRE